MSFSTRVNICTWFTSEGFIFIVLWYVLLYLLTISSNSSILKSYTYKFYNVLINLVATTDFSSLCVEYISISFFSNYDFIDLLQNSLPLSTRILFRLWSDSFKMFWKALAILILFFIFPSNGPCIFAININYT